ERLGQGHREKNGGDAAHRPAQIGWLGGHATGKERGIIRTRRSPMQLFLDTTDVGLLKELVATGLVDGVTTNPTLIAKSGRPMLEVIAEICDLVEGPVSAEVAATDVAGMLAEGTKLAGVAPNVVVKLPLTREGLIATAEFAVQGIQTNVTLCFSAAQA